MACAQYCAINAGDAQVGELNSVLQQADTFGTDEMRMVRVGGEAAIPSSSSNYQIKP
jgi:hypothetical protein